MNIIQEGIYAIVNKLTIGESANYEGWLPGPVKMMLYNPYAQAMFVLGVMTIIAVYVYGRTKEAES